MLKTRLLFHYMGGYIFDHSEMGLTYTKEQASEMKMARAKDPGVNIILYWVQVLIISVMMWMGASHLNPSLYRSLYNKHRVHCCPTGWW